ncbi:MAG TPA: hypothetical protein VIY28_04575 [Pseudonocardiaceae bacterium]
MATWWEFLGEGGADHGAQFGGGEEVDVQTVPTGRGQDVLDERHGRFAVVAPGGVLDVPRRRDLLVHARRA